MDNYRLERKQRIERNRKLRQYRNVNKLTYLGIFVTAAIITIAAASSRTDKITYVDMAKMTSIESIELNNSKTDKVAAQVETTTEATSYEDITDDTVDESADDLSANDSDEETTQNVPETSDEQKVGEDSANNLDLGARVQVTADTLYVRAEMSTDSDIVGIASMDDEFYVLEKEGEWVLVNYQGQDGYVKAEFLKSAE